MCIEWNELDTNSFTTGRLVIGRRVRACQFGGVLTDDVLLPAPDAHGLSLA